MKKYPIVFFIFRRPESTAKILKEIIKSNPPKLYIFSDAGRNEEEKAQVAKTREVVDYMLKKVDFPIIRQYQKHNIGPVNYIYSGLGYAFTKEKCLIIIEDDCLPNQDFFTYCNYFLEKFINNNNYGSISGISLKGLKPGFYVSNLPRAWGWATWRRTWNIYEARYRTNLMVDNKVINRYFKNPISRWYWHKIIQLTNKGIIKGWDYNWIYFHLENNLLSIFPSKNLISNIGYDSMANNTSWKSPQLFVDREKLPLSAYFDINDKIIITRKINNYSYVNIYTIIGLCKKMIENLIFSINNAQSQ